MLHCIWCYYIWASSYKYMIYIELISHTSLSLSPWPPISLCCHRQLYFYTHITHTCMILYIYIKSGNRRLPLNMLISSCIHSFVQDTDYFFFLDEKISLCIYFIFYCSCNFGGKHRNIHTACSHMLTLKLGEANLISRNRIGSKGGRRRIVNRKDN